MPITVRCVLGRVGVESKAGKTYTHAGIGGSFDCIQNCRSCLTPFRRYDGSAQLQGPKFLFLLTAGRELLDYGNSPFCEQLS